MKKNDVLKTFFNEYKLIEKIGEGGNSYVWKADCADKKFVAIKILKCSETKVYSRFKNEVKFCMNSLHPQIAPIIDVGLAGETPFCVLPLYKCNLRKLMKNNIKPQNKIDAFVKILKGIKYAHDNNVIHRDLKPENIFVKDEELVIGDFGIAQIPYKFQATCVETTKEDRLANFSYASPEQRQRNSVYVSAKTDLYSAALILNEMFTGTIPSAVGFVKIKDVEPSYGFLDEIVDWWFKQDPNDRINNEEDALIFINSSIEKIKQDKDIKKIKNDIETSMLPEIVCPKNPQYSYVDSILYVEFENDFTDDWFKVISCQLTSYEWMDQVLPDRLMPSGNNVLFLPLKNLTKSNAVNIKNIINGWIARANEIYSQQLIEQYEMQIKKKENQLREYQEHISLENDVNKILQDG